MADVRHEFPRRLSIVYAAFKGRRKVLAHDADLSTGYLSELRQGRRNPTLDVIVRLADAAGVHYLWLLGAGSDDDFLLTGESGQFTPAQVNNEGAD